jgi:hypothetical protein
MSIDSQYIESVLWKTFACVIGLGLGAFAQTEETKVVVNLDGFRYPVIAKQAGIQGNVVFRVSRNRRELVSSANTLLKPAAEDNLKTWTLPPLAAGGYVVTYHFSILDRKGCLNPRGPDPVASYAIKRARNVRIDVVASAFAVCSIN